jgi:hypothetical protein
MAERKPDPKKPAPAPAAVAPPAAATALAAMTRKPGEEVGAALQAARPKPPGLLTRLFAGLVHKTAPDVEPLEQQERRYAAEAMQKPETPEQARERQHKAEELRKLAEVQAFKQKMPPLAFTQRLLEKPSAQNVVEIDVPVKRVEGAPGAPAKPAAPAPEILPMRERYAPPARLPETPEAAKREAEKIRKKAEETEAEVLLRDVMALTEQQAAASVETGGPVHRRYLLRRQQREEAAAAAETPRAGEAEPAETVRVRAPPETLEREEFSALMQDVYSQLEATKKEQPTLSEQLGVKEPPRPAAPAGPAGAPAGEAPKPGSLEDLLGLKPAAKPEGAPIPRVEAGPAALPEGAPLFAQLGEISGKPAEEKKPAVALVDVEAKKGMGCPTCHSTNAKIVFCPYCATGMCANCSPKIVPTPDAIIYTCPKCGEEVTIKKKRP